jgi:hypothetical protein
VNGSGTVPGLAAADAGWAIGKAAGAVAGACRAKLRYSSGLRLFQVSDGSRM